jgi:hypothetical protein
MVQQIRPSGLEKQGFRNLVYNGDMLVHQRTGSIQVTTSDTRVLDGFGVETRDSDGASYDATWSQSTTVPAGQGFKYSLKCDVASTTSPSGSDNYLLRHCIEDRNLQHLDVGTANAKDITISFWVRSSKTGTYCFQIRDMPATDHALVEYTISSADTWEHKVITIAGNTGGNMTVAGNAGYDLHWHLSTGSGDHVSATSNAFADNSSNLFRSTSNQVNLFDSATAEWYITGVQFEVGNQASEFEHVPFDVQLQRCKRYYQKLTGSYAQYGQICNGHYNGDTQFQGAYTYPVEMRGSPSLVHTTTSSDNSSSAYAIAVSGTNVDYIDSLVLYNPNDHSTLIYTGSGTASSTGGRGGNLYVQSTITELALDAEFG